MNIQYSSDNMEISESMKVLAESKLKKLARYWVDLPKESTSVRVVMNSAPEDTFKVKLDVNLNGDVYYADEDGFELESTLIGAVEEVSRQYEKRKTKSERNWEAKREGKILTEEELEELAASSDELLDYSEYTADGSQE